MGRITRLPEDVAQEIAWLIQSGGVDKPHPHTVDYVHRQVHIALLQDSIAWVRFIRTA